MTRTQKKCFFFSVGLHGLLAAVFVGTSGFREKPPQQDVLVMVNIPSDIRDVSDANAGGPGATPTPAPAQSAPPVPQPKVQPVVQPQPKPRPQPKLAVTPPPEPRPEPVERPRERETEEATARPTFTPKPVKVRPPRHHEVHVDYTPVTADDHRKLTAQRDAEAAEAESRAEARAEARRMKSLTQNLEALANGVESSGAKATVVNLPGQGGGAAFAGYNTVIFNAYYHAWITPDSTADRLAAVEVKIVVARDGSIISADVTNPSGDSALNRSVEKALRAVRKLPPFPSGATDDQRSFLIRFNLDTKESSG